MKRIIPIFAASLALLASRVTLAQATLDPLIVVGGSAGTWDTVLDISNPFANRLLIIVQGDIVRDGAICAACDLTSFELPPNGSVRLSAKDSLGSQQGFQAIRILAAFPGTPLIGNGPSPAVKARLVNLARPTQGTDLPVTRLSTISEGDGLLSFPSAARTSSAHSNLVLARVDGADTKPLSVSVEVFAPSGDSIASGPVVIPEGASSISVVDVLGQLGVGSVDGGQIRITQGSAGQVWGLLATAYDDGRITVSAGKNP